MIDQRRFFSIDYVDEDGDQCIKHVLATPEEIEELFREFTRRGMRAAAYEISHSDVNSRYAQIS